MMRLGITLLYLLHLKLKGKKMLRTCLGAPIYFWWLKVTRKFLESLQSNFFAVIYITEQIRRNRNLVRLLL